MKLSELIKLANGETNYKSLELILASHGVKLTNSDMWYLINAIKRAVTYTTIEEG